MDETETSLELLIRSGKQAAASYLQVGWEHPQLVEASSVDSVHAQYDPSKEARCEIAPARSSAPQSLLQPLLSADFGFWLHFGPSAKFERVPQSVFCPVRKNS